MKNISDTAYYHLWEQELVKHIPHYDAFFGFSLGGVILQQCFSLFVSNNKPIVLFSTPTYSDQALTQKLGEVIDLCKKNHVDEALQSLYQHVYYPNSIPTHSYEPLNSEIAAKRLIYGLTRVLETDSTLIVKESNIKHLHLIGEHSYLVNANNVVAPKTGRLLTVPGAGMRVLSDNLSYCKHAIWETLNSEV